MQNKENYVLKNCLKFYKKDVFRVVQNRLPRRYTPCNDGLVQTRHCKECSGVAIFTRINKQL